MFSSQEFPTKPSVIVDSIAAPVAPAAPIAPQPPQTTFIPIDAVTPDQSIPGKFNYFSPTWKYLQIHFNVRLIELNRKNANVSLSFEKTQVVRGQIKEIKLLLNHTNQLAGIVPPKKPSLDANPSTDKGPSYE